MRWNLRIEFWFILLLLFGGAAWGQSFQPLFNYQGRLTDDTGTPLEGFFTLHFTIEKASVVGDVTLWAPIWQSSRVDVPLNDGFFSVNLGEVEPLPEDFLGNDLKLVLGVENYPEFSTELRMTWAPQAIFSANAMKLDGLASSAYDQSSHLADFENPHAVTAAQTGAMSEAAVLQQVDLLEQQIATKSDLDHNHDEAYYDKAEVDQILAALATRIDELEQALQDLPSPDPAFGGAIRREGDDLIIEGVNVAIRNGSGQTDSSNGLGNLIVGYNLAQEGTEPPRFRTGSHNLVVGDLHSYRSYGSLAAGRDNDINSRYTVATGTGNTAYGAAAMVLGGTGNTADIEGSIVLGGSGNSVWGTGGIIIGGSVNSVDGEDGLVVGGTRNNLLGEGALIVGGVNNRNDVPHSPIIGRSNQITGGIR